MNSFWKRVKRQQERGTEKYIRDGVAESKKNHNFRGNKAAKKSLVSLGNLGKTKFCI